MSVGAPDAASLSPPPLVLLHGWGGSFTSTWDTDGWRSRLRALERQVIRLDLPGHGAAPQPEHPADPLDPLDPAAYADLAAMVRRRLPAHGCVDIIAYSLGAKLALALAVREPGLVRRAVLCGLGGNAFAPERHGAALAALLEQGLTDDAPPALAALARYGLANGNHARRIAAVLRRPPNPLIEPAALAGISCPILLVAGDQDAVAQPLAPLLQALPGARQLMLAGVDHLSLPAQALLIDAALDFCSS